MKHLHLHLKKHFEIRIFPFLRINIWFFPVAFCSLWGGYSHLFFVAFTIALIHEVSHVLCAFFMKVPVSHITVYPFGIAAHLSSGYINHSQKEFFIAFAGPFMNIIMYWLFCFAYLRTNWDLLKFCADVNLAMCATNILPALPLDGGRMLKSILTAKYGILRSYNFLFRLSRILIVIILIFATVVFVVSNFNFSLILISAFLLQNLSHEQMSLSHITMNEIMENTQKIKKHEVFPTKTFCVEKNTRASVIMKYLSYDYYCVFHILDENSSKISTVTETTVLSALTRHGIRIKFSDIHMLSL